MYFRVSSCCPHRRHPLCCLLWSSRLPLPWQGWRGGQLLLQRVRHRHDLCCGLDYWVWTLETAAPTQVSWGWLRKQGWVYKFTMSHIDKMKPLARMTYAGLKVHYPKWTSWRSSCHSSKSPPPGKVIIWLQDVRKSQIVQMKKVIFEIVFKKFWNCISPFCVTFETLVFKHCMNSAKHFFPKHFLFDVGFRSYDH